MTRASSIESSLGISNASSQTSSLRQSLEIGENQGGNHRDVASFHELQALDNLRTQAQTDRSTSAAIPTPIMSPGDHHQLAEHSIPITTQYLADSKVISRSIPIPPKNKWRFFSACVMSFANGVGDASPGALIPYIEEYYYIGYGVLSLIFVSNAVGFIISAPVASALESKLGRAWLYWLTQVILAASYVLLVCTPPFGVVVFAYLLIGFGASIALSLNNVFCAQSAHVTTALGLIHGSYGLGGTVGPLLATVIASRGVQWTRFYFFSLSIALFNVGFATWAFWNYEKAGQLQGGTTDSSATYSHPVITGPNDIIQMKDANTGNSPRSQEFTLPKDNKLAFLKLALRNNITQIGAIFIFAYQGAEVSISGWIVSFLISYRGGSPARVGYVSAGFWAGIMVGRFALSHPLHHLLGIKAAVFIIVLGTLGLQLIVWLVPDIIGDAVVTSIIGLLLGPVYPCAMSAFSRLLPPNGNIQISSLGFIGALGSSGGAAAPFVTGIWAQKAGTVILHPICIFLYVVMEASWFCLPGITKE